MNTKILLDEIIEIYLNITTIKELQKYGVNFDIVYDTPYINCFYSNKLFTISLSKEINEDINSVINEKIIGVSIHKEFGIFDISIDDLNLDIYNIDNLKSKWGSNIKLRNNILFNRKSKKISVFYENYSILLIYYNNKLSEIYFDLLF